MSTNKDNTKKIEKRIFKLFLKLEIELGNFDSAPLFDDRPDITIEYKNKKIGLELTKQPTSIGETQSKYSDFISTVCKKLTDKINDAEYHINGSVMFKNPIKKQGREKEGKLIEYLFDLFTKNYESLDCNEEFGPKMNLELMDPISTFCFQKVHSKELSKITLADGIILPFLKSECIQKTISKKNDKLKQYKKCDEHWLLIHFGHDFSDEFDRTWKKTFFKVSSDFNRVYLLDERSGGYSKLIFKN